MRRYRLTALSAGIFLAAQICASDTSPVLIPGLFLLFFIPQVIILGLQCCDVVHSWEEFREEAGEEACEKVPFMVVYKEKISCTPFMMTPRAIAVMLGINLDRAGPSFVMA